LIKTEKVGVGPPCQFSCNSKSITLTVFISIIP
jgi:hypothetical protein